MFTDSFLEIANSHNCYTIEQYEFLEDLSNTEELKIFTIVLNDIENPEGFQKKLIEKIESQEGFYVHDTMDLNIVIEGFKNISGGLLDDNKQFKILIQLIDFGIKKRDLID